MNCYQTEGNMTLRAVETEKENAPEAVKVKVTHVLVSPSDVNAFVGKYNLSVPMTVGRCAIGVVSDDRLEYGLRRGNKVILNPYVEGRSERFCAPSQIKVRGVDTDGFLSDFVHIMPDRMILFPEGLVEKKAIFTDKVAVALSALHTFPHEKGEHIVIIGSDTVCCILAQLALYFQLVPVMIGTDERELKFAESKGVYYTVDATKEVPVDRIKEITGGRMAKSVVAQLKNGSAYPYLFRILAHGGKCVIMCEDKDTHNLDVDVSAVGKTGLHIEGVANGAEEFQSAVNILLQNNALDLSGYIDKEEEIKNAEMLLRDMANNVYYFNAVIKI